MLFWNFVNYITKTFYLSIQKVSLWETFLSFVLFRKKDINRKVVVTRYLKYLIISLGIFIITSFISVFVIPNILKFF